MDGQKVDQRKVIENYHIDISNLTELLCKLVNSYRLLIGGAEELNSIALASKKDVKKAIHRADELGEVIDKMIDCLEDSSEEYLNYCKIKCEVMHCKVSAESIKAEIEQVINP